MSQCSKMKHSRTQWKEKAKQRGKGERYERREKARMKARNERSCHQRQSSWNSFFFNMF
jgi:protein subunit release factor B